MPLDMSYLVLNSLCSRTSARFTVSCPSLVQLHTLTDAPTLDLSEPIDVYSEWIDATEEANAEVSGLWMRSRA